MKIAIVTGGSRGLGAALCEEYLRRGWRVVEFSRSAPHPYSIALDLSDTQSAARILAETFAGLAAGGPDEVVAIGNAAVLGPVGATAAADPAGIARSVDVNVTGGILFASRFVAAFEACACPKTFVNVSSGAAVKAHAGWSLYSAGKAAMEHFVRVLAVEQASLAASVRAFSVNPGVMDTAMQAEVRSATAEQFPELERFIGFHERGELVSPTAVASWIAELVASRPEPGATYGAGR